MFGLLVFPRMPAWYATSLDPPPKAGRSMCIQHIAEPAAFLASCLEEANLESWGSLTCRGHGKWRKGTLGPVWLSLLPGRPLMRSSCRSRACPEAFVLCVQADHRRRQGPNMFPTCVEVFVIRPRLCTVTGEAHRCSAETRVARAHTQDVQNGLA